MAVKQNPEEGSGVMFNVTDTELTGFSPRQSMAAGGGIEQGNFGVAKFSEFAKSGAPKSSGGASEKILTSPESGGGKGTPFK